jgi:hypothetical protein
VFVSKKENKTSLANLKMKDYSNNHCPKDVKCLMAKIREDPNCIETTRIRKAMKEAPANSCKIHKVYNLVLQIINKVL